MQYRDLIIGPFLVSLLIYMATFAQDVGSGVNGTIPPSGNLYLPLVWKIVLSVTPTSTAFPAVTPTAILATATPIPTQQPTNCDPSYPDFCIPSPPPNLNCMDVIPHKNFRVLPPDPHGFDRNHDGIGCEG